LEEIKNSEISESIKVLHVNIRSLRKNWEAFNQQISDMNIEWEVIILTEINIKKEEVQLYKINGYVGFTITRESTKRGGGIMVFTKSKLGAECKETSCGENGVIEINIEKNNKPFTKIFVVYRKPTSNKKLFIKELKELIVKSEKQKWKYQMLIGDINIDILENTNDIEDKHDQLVIDQYENTLASLGFQCKVNSPTREEIVMKNGKGHLQQSCIDHIYTKCKTGESSAGVLTEKISDHYSVIGWMWDKKIDKTIEIENKQIDDKYWKFNNKKIAQEINHINWDILNDKKCPEEIYVEIIEQLNKIYLKNKNLVVKNNKVSEKKQHKRKEWITEDLVQKIENKNKLWNKIKDQKDVNNELLIEYKREKKIVSKMIKDCKHSFFSNKLNELKKNKRTVWDVVNNITGKEIKKNIDKEIQKTFESKKLIDVVNEFNENFGNQVKI
jgi:hypothetical protein